MYRAACIALGYVFTMCCASRAGRRSMCLAQAALRPGEAWRSRRSRACSALGQQVFQPGFEVGTHQHSFHSVHRPPILKQHQRGQRCSTRGMRDRQAESAGALQCVLNRADHSSSREQQVASVAEQLVRTAATVHSKRHPQPTTSTQQRTSYLVLPRHCRILFGVNLQAKQVEDFSRRNHIAEQAAMGTGNSCQSCPASPAASPP